VIHAQTRRIATRCAARPVTRGPPSRPLARRPAPQRDTDPVKTGIVYNFALDLDGGRFWAGQNGTWYNGGNPATGTNCVFRAHPIARSGRT
jgi:hypothetical protein